MKWRLSLEGASVLAACTDRMENVCVMQRTATRYSPLCTYTQIHIIGRDMHWIWMLIAVIYRQVYNQLWLVCVNISAHITWNPKPVTLVLKMTKHYCFINSLGTYLILYLSLQKRTVHVRFHGCLFIHSCYEGTVYLYLFGHTCIQATVFSSICGQIAVCSGVLLCSCQLLSKHSNGICLRFHSFQFLFLFRGFPSVHLIECASMGQIHSSLFFSKHISFFIQP